MLDEGMLYACGAFFGMIVSECYFEKVFAES